jgi:hypothetical protein
MFLLGYRYLLLAECKGEFVKTNNSGMLCSVDTLRCMVGTREMENVSRDPTFGDFVTIRTEGSMKDVTVARLQIQEYRLSSPSSFKCNVLRESLSVDSQNIPCATPKRRGSWVISIYLW